MKVALSKEQQTLYSRLYVSRIDLAQASFCAGFLLKKGWHSNPWERRGTIYQQQSAFTSAMIVAYARPFARSDGWPALPAELKKFSAEERKFHGRILALRRQVYAHSDSVSYNIQPWRRGNLKATIVNLPVLRVTADDAKLLQAIVTKLNKAIGKRLDELVP